ncbi:hypothetical protein TNCV_2210601 [Trichonephila clavipes]|nr:hypothetical protein TNCV_2210601 [Trichonephila clavipes]
MSIARKFKVIGEDIFASKMKRLEISLEEDNFFRATTSQSSNNSRSKLNLFQFLKTGGGRTAVYSSMGLMRAKKICDAGNLAKVLPRMLKVSCNLISSLCFQTLSNAFVRSRRAAIVVLVREMGLKSLGDQLFLPAFLIGIMIALFHSAGRRPIFQDNNI